MCKCVSSREGMGIVGLMSSKQGVSPMVQIFLKEARNGGAALLLEILDNTK